MSLRGCFACLKFIVFIVNFLFWLIGLGVVAVCLWLLFDQQLYLQGLGGQENDFFIGTYVLLGIGAIMTFVGFLGCCGAWRESSWMLGTFFLFLIAIFLSEITLAVLLYFQEAPYQAIIERSVEATVSQKYTNRTSVTSQTFDLIQEGLQCCGSRGPADWSRSAYNGFSSSSSAREIGIPVTPTQASSFGLSEFKLPASCCKNPATRACKKAISSVAINRIPTDIVYAMGCSDPLIDFVEQHVIYLVAVAGGIAAIQFLGMTFSICLCCALRSIDDEFKA